MTPPHGRTVKDDGQTRAPAEKPRELTGTYEVTLGRNGSDYTVRVYQDQRRLTGSEALEVLTVAYGAARGYVDNGSGPAGRCGASFAPIGGGALPACELRHGHDGWHRDGVTEWSRSPVPLVRHDGADTAGA